MSNGEKRAKEFIDQRLNKKLVAFDATLSKQKVPPFDATDKSVSAAIRAPSKNKVSFTKLLIIGQLRNIDISYLIMRLAKFHVHYSRTMAK